MSLCSSLRCARNCVVTFSRTLSLFQQQRCQIGTGKTSQSPVIEEASQSRPDVDSTLNVAVRPPLPIIVSRKLDKPNPYVAPKQAWLESMDTLEGEKLGLLDLHPDVFGAHPRENQPPFTNLSLVSDGYDWGRKPEHWFSHDAAHMSPLMRRPVFRVHKYDILWDNVRWQQTYKTIDYRTCLTRAEVKGGGRKPWPQKGTGKHRAGSIRAPQWKGGGMSHGPRGPRSFFHMLSTSKRQMGLRVALTVKYAQNDLHIVDSLEIPTDDPEYIQNLIDTRYWGFSVLFIDDVDMMPKNISLATNEYGQYNLMPVYGLNVYSMLKHETLVLTLAALEKIEEKLLAAFHTTERHEKFRRGAYKNFYAP